MNSGSRPIARIARTGELTPPARTAHAREYSSAERESFKAAGTAPETIFDARVWPPNLSGRRLALTRSEAVRTRGLSRGGSVSKEAVCVPRTLERDGGLVLELGRTSTV
jgi:hypothetical protein